MTSGQLRDGTLDWRCFLEREPLPEPGPEVVEALRGKRILVTGAAGSIGRELSLRLAALRPKALVLLDASEQGIYRLGERLSGRVDRAGSGDQARQVLGSVNDRELLNEVFEEHAPEVVFHAAAYKHLALLEAHPLAAMENNALGTGALVECARRHGAERLVLLSTDKAAAPSSVLGASKRIAERVVTESEGVALRLGNVLGSEGSVAEVFLRQMAEGRPLSVTDPAAERYFLTAAEAVELLLSAAVEAPAGCVLAPRLTRVHTVAELADFLVGLNVEWQRLPIKATGLRDGEKLREALWSDEEQSAVLPATVMLDAWKEKARLHASLMRAEMKALETAVRERDLPAAMAVVQRLVPDYAPSATVQKLMQQPRAGAARR